MARREEPNHPAIAALIMALADLEHGRRALASQTTPHTPLPRSRLLLLAGVAKESQEKEKSFWFDGGSSIEWRCVLVRRDKHDLFWGIEQPEQRAEMAAAIADVCGWQPRRMLRALRRIQAATAWCQARAAGRQRAAAEILRQQAGAAAMIEAEAALVALGH